MTDRSATHDDTPDHDVLLTIANDVKWVRESLEKGQKRMNAQDKRIQSLEKSRTAITAVCGFLAFVASAMGLERAHDWLDRF